MQKNGKIKKQTDVDESNKNSSLDTFCSPGNWEINNLSSQYSEKVKSMNNAWEVWAKKLNIGFVSKK